MQHSKRKGLLALVLVVAMPLAQAGHHGHKNESNIVETAAAAGQFKTLIAAAKAAGLVGALTGDADLTVFAPTDAAFNALPAGTIESLLKPENKDQLARILKFHVIAGDIRSSALADGARLDTLAGPTAVISAAEEGFLIQNARIINVDIGASNGVVHVIDRVILPPNETARNRADDIIRMAIAKGAPMYNHGNPEATVAVYTMATQSLLNLAELNRVETQRLNYGLMKSSHAGDASASAWALRYALDDVLGSLNGHAITMDSMTASN